MRKIITLLLAFIVLTSCVSKKKIVYLNDAKIGAQQGEEQYKSIFQPDDILLITITAKDPELALDFNLMYINSRSNNVTSISNSPDLYTYLIDKNGDINFPVLGKLRLAGLTRIEAENKIKELLKDYIKDAGVIIRLLNFKVSVIGEVSRPGAYPIEGERVTLLEALSKAGDLTIYGNRKNIKVIREIDNVKTIAEIDLTKDDFFKSEYYYLSHNDIVYVEPNKTRINSSVIGPNITVGISAISLIITIIALSSR